MTLKEIKNEERITKQGEYFVYQHFREVRLEDEDLLNMATNQTTKISEIESDLKKLDLEKEKAKNFLKKHSKLIDDAKKREDTRYCEKCGLDFKKEPKFKGKKYCKNCESRVGVQ